MLRKLQTMDGLALFLISLSIISLSNVVVYYSIGISKTSSSVIFLVMALALFSLCRSKKLPRFGKMRIVDMVIIALDLLLLYLIYQSRTLDVIPSPWMKLGPLFFLLYALTSIFLFQRVSRSQNAFVSHAQTILHLFVTYGVAAIFYPLGFGFDGFIHRATETWIAHNGFILPKQPFYIGQYGLVVWLHHITHIPLAAIDVYLVPLLASLTLPISVSRTLRKTWNIEFKKSLLYFWIIPIIFYLSLHLTTPHNLVILLLFLGVFTTLPYLYNKDVLALPLCLSLLAVATHPLIGAPLLLFVLMAYLVKKMKAKKSILTLYTLLLAISVPAMFTTHLLLTHQPLPTFLNPFDQITHFADLLARPYWYAQTSPIHMELLYAWQWIIGPLVTVLGLVGFYTYKKKRTIDYLFFASWIGFLLGAYLLRSWIVFPNVIQLEQGDYPLRLLKTSVIFLLPYVLLLIHKMYTRLTKSIMRSGVYVVVAAMLMVSLYLSYPQRNQKVWFPGFNVSLSDMKAAQWIEEDNEDANYIVLSNPMVSMAALEQYSFKKSYDTRLGELFYYAIPTGGPLYKIYQNMLYEGQKKEYMQEALDLTNAQKAYFVVNDYWSNFENIVSGAQKNADSRHDIDGGRIVIFTYTPSEP